MVRPTLLIPVVFPDPDIYPITDMSIAELDGFNVVLYGYWEVPETTTPEAAREAHEIEAEAILYEMAAEFSHAGAATDIQLHFGPAGADQSTLQQRISEDTAADAVLLATHLRSVTNVLVPLRDARHGEQMVDFLSAFDTDSIFVVELYHVAADEDAVTPAESMLESVKETLLARGFSEGNLKLTVEVADDAQSAITERARSHNIIVLGETEQGGFEDRLFGPTSEYIADESETPTIVIRSPE